MCWGEGMEKAHTDMNKGITGSTGLSRSCIKTSENETSWGHSIETTTETACQFSSC